MWGDMSLWNVQGPLLHSRDHIVPRILTVDYTFNYADSAELRKSKGIVEKTYEFNNLHKR